VRDSDELDPEGPGPEDIGDDSAETIPCPCCGWEQYYALYDIDNFFICPGCGVYSWLRYKYIDQNRQIVYGLQLVPGP
jgi:hypothetical protein